MDPTNKNAAGFTWTKHSAFTTALLVGGALISQYLIGSKVSETAEASVTVSESITEVRAVEATFGGNDQVRELASFMEKRVARIMKPAFRKQAHGITETIIAESKRYSFDPLFVMAVIMNESRFNPNAIGSVGEIGLMQLRPETAEWIVSQSDADSKLAKKWKGPSTLRNYKFNIALGTYYLHMLRSQLGTWRHIYLAAYNMGPGNASKYLKQKKMPVIYSSKVLVHYMQFYMDLRAEMDSNRTVTRIAVAE